MTASLAQSVGPTQLIEVLLHVAPRRPVFIWGAPGIGKSALVQRFAEQVGLACVSLVGSQLAPEDIMGVPRIVGGVSEFCPPKMIARDEPYCLFLDELNACTQDVQKAFYSLIHDRRIGSYALPAGSVVIGEGNRAQDAAIVRPMSSALINRMVHVQLAVSHPEWMAWAVEHGLHPLVLEYLTLRPDQLWSQPHKHEAPFSTPRSWHMLSDALHEYGEGLSDRTIMTLASGCLSPVHAGQFRAFHKQLSGRFRLDAILQGEARWPASLEDRDVLYFLAQSFRARLIRELPASRDELTPPQKEMNHRAKALVRELAAVALEMTQLLVVKSDDGGELPPWFLMELVRDLPRLAA